MKFVDDNLLGTSQVRSGKSGSKSAGKSQDMNATHQRAAFENAFADAGKKKQPVISIGAKPAVENSLSTASNTVSQNLPAAAAKIPVMKHEAAAAVVAADIVVSKDNNVNALAPDTGDDNRSLLPGFIPEDEGFVPEDDGFMKSAIGNSVDTTLLARAKTMPLPDVEQKPVAAEDVDHTLKFTLTPPDSKGGPLPSVSLAGLGKDAVAGAGKAVDTPVVEKMTVLLKDAKVQASKYSDLKAEKSGETPPSKASAAADEATDATSADVSQLLTLLDAVQKPVAASQPVRVETTPAMSEFQALAERAGQAKPAPKEAIAAKADGRLAADVSAVKADANAVENATQAGSDQIFRFARADGKGQAVSMSIASDGNKTEVRNEAPAAASKGETVTVLEARRYLGLAPTSNAAAVTSQIASNPEWARALQPSAAASNPLTHSSTGKVLNTLKIQMHPIDLGMVTATLRLKDDELHVEIKVETGDAFRQLSDDQGAMVKALRAQGFAVDQVNIVFNASDSSGGSNAQQQAQPQAGQQGRETAGDGAKGQRNDNGSRQQGGERWTGNEGTSDASSGAELNRAGDVYM